MFTILGDKTCKLVTVTVSFQSSGGLIDEDEYVEEASAMVDFFELPLCIGTYIINMCEVNNDITRSLGYLTKPVDP